MAKFALINETDHAGNKRRQTLLNVDAIIGIFAVGPNHCFIVTTNYN